MRIAAVDRVVDAVAPRIKPVVDAFASPLTAAHYVELVNPLWSSRRLQGRVVDVRDETSDSRTLVIQPGRNWRRHRAGQHMRIGLSVDGRHYTRTYSISSSPERPDGLITITVKVHPGGRMSRVLVRDVEVGTHMPLGIPQGEFVLPDAKPVRPLFITAGSGITPVASMLRTYDLVGNVPDIAHIHYAPHEYDFIFGEELHALADRYPRHYALHPVYTRQLRASEAQGEAAGDDRTSSDRHFSAEQLEELVPDWRGREVWACGPQGLLDAVEAHMAERGRSRHLHVERFRAAMAELDDDAEGGTVRFAVGSDDRADDVVAEADGTTPLLRVAEDAGLNPAHGCRMGICHTCDTPLLDGRVRDLRSGQLISEAGHVVQVCVAAAAGDCRIELRT